CTDACAAARGPPPGRPGFAKGAAVSWLRLVYLPLLASGGEVRLVLGQGDQLGGTHDAVGRAVRKKFQSYAACPLLERCRATAGTVGVVLAAAPGTQSPGMKEKVDVAPLRRDRHPLGIGDGISLRVSIDLARSDAQVAEPLTYRRFVVV